MTHNYDSGDDAFAAMQEAQAGGDAGSARENSDGLSLETPEQADARLGVMANAIIADRALVETKDREVKIADNEEIQRIENELGLGANEDGGSLEQLRKEILSRQ